MAKRKCISKDFALSLMQRGGVLYEDINTKIIHRVNTETREHLIEHVDKPFYYIELNKAHYNIRKADLKSICEAANIDRGAIKRAPEWFSVAAIV